MSTADILAIALGLDALASTVALVYVVRRVAQQPKPPAPSQPRTPRSSRNQASADTPDPGQQVLALNGSVPAGSTT